MQLNSVVLPAPFGPIRPQIAPRATSKDDVLERGHAAEPDRHALDREQRGGRGGPHPSAPPALASASSMDLPFPHRPARQSQPTAAVLTFRARLSPALSRTSSMARLAEAQAGARGKPARRPCRSCRRPRDCGRGRECRAPPPAASSRRASRGRRRSCRASRPRPASAASMRAASAGVRLRREPRTQAASAARSLFVWSAKARNMRCIGSARLVERRRLHRFGDRLRQADAAHQPVAEAAENRASARARVRRARGRLAIRAPIE